MICDHGPCCVPSLIILNKDFFLAFVKGNLLKKGSDKSTILSQIGSKMIIPKSKDLGDNCLQSCHGGRWCGVMVGNCVLWQHVSGLR